MGILRGLVVVRCVRVELGGISKSCLGLRVYHSDYLGQHFQACIPIYKQEVI